MVSSTHTEYVINVLSSRPNQLLNRLVVELGTLSSQSDIKQLGLSSDNHPSLSSKLEVGSNSSGVDLANELASGVPDVDTITAASVHTALGVSMDT